ncbi:MAG: SEC-C metal-binding domain-containing protein, partial [Patescibacteria group bacterium]
ETQFMVSLDDDLMRIFGGDRIKSLMDRFRFPENMPINNSMISRAIERAQTQVEGYYFDTRKRLLEYDEILNKQRDSIYNRRQKILENKDVKGEIIQIFSDEFNDIVSAHAKDEEYKWNFEEITEIISSFGIMEIDEAREVILEIKKENISAEQKQQKLQEIFNKKALDLYNEREKEIGKDGMELVDKELLLRSIDTSWGDYIDSMEHLRRSVGLRAVGGKDPLIEYKIEAKKSFQDLLYDINNKVTSALFKLKLKVQPKKEEHQHIHLKAKANQNTEVPIIPRAFTDNFKLNNDDENNVQSLQTNKKIGRNEPCYCGSDKKFKKCHGN